MEGRALMRLSGDRVNESMESQPAVIGNGTVSFRADAQLLAHGAAVWNRRSDAKAVDAVRVCA
jgi:hypothetical protein